MFWRWRLMVWLSVLWRDVLYTLWSDCLGATRLSSLTLMDARCASVHLMYLMCLPKTLPPFSRVFINQFGCHLNVLLTKWYINTTVMQDLCNQCLVNTFKKTSVHFLAHWQAAQAIFGRLPSMSCLCDVNLGNPVCSLCVCVRACVCFECICTFMTTRWLCGLRCKYLSV